MNIYDLRKIIHVTNFYLTPKICSVDYIKDHAYCHISLQRVHMFSELEAIGSIETYMPVEEYINYQLSQWDALNIVLRYELQKEQEKEIESGDIGKAINKLKNYE